MKKLLVLGMLLSSFLASAANYEVRCDLKNDFDDWSVYVGSDKANFFDNDSHYDMEFRYVRGENYIFTNRSEFQNLSFFFNQSAMEGTLIISYSDGETNEYSMFCKYENISF